MREIVRIFRDGNEEQYVLQVCTGGETVLEMVSRMLIFEDSLRWFKRICRRSLKNA